VLDTVPRAGIADAERAVKAAQQGKARIAAVGTPS